MKKLEDKQLIIAIDGPASSGKSTVAKRIADQLNLIYVDSGAMYRTITYVAIKEHIDLTDEKKIVNALERVSIEFERTEEGQSVFCNNKEVTDDIRQNDVTNAVSIVAAHPLVREVLVDRQRKIAMKQNVIMDGRDIGTVVLPDASVKIFLVASVDERAERRYKENRQKGIKSDLTKLKQEISERDYKDSTRKVSPLRKADDAFEIDTTALSIDEVAEQIKKIIFEKYPKLRK
ncbi:cytidylate kinase [Marinilactibacillus psychrotolerans]|uniref:Cytidylate kinase n=2 Tax=Marinilactibacillus psychrotolerans TaxID=191770 RepID=A0AAV3WV35_9LACT|nr:cytidylate kinase [Marinilactibacillus psychrotolerans]SDC59280.1 cytidylate kinase [Marinilactibacillus psychrotolerans]SJN34489.1 Cytidylate kinase [Marinilactibacillus psychrotolerans 42ea]